MRAHPQVLNSTDDCIRSFYVKINFASVAAIGLIRLCMWMLMAAVKHCLAENPFYLLLLGVSSFGSFQGG